MLRRDARALGHGGELGPCHVRIDGGLADPSAVATVAAADHILAADQVGVAADAMRDQLGMLDEVRLGLDHAGDQRLTFGNLTRSNSCHSCAWRGLAASSEMARGLAKRTISMMSASGTSQWCGSS